MIFGHKMGQNSYCSIYFAKFDDITATLSLIVLKPNILWILPYSIPNFGKIKRHLHGQKNRSILLKGGGGDVATPSTPSICLILGPRR